ncbi:Predicted arabinose efflux permease, MFS family [Jatrophihabitans endophyticus]|uniref:Predicted arabinose efflux permease, MFS family n=1 Tax=Jatrophihabitans endophyticus TaxID=1206085 RepID=A0A1M5S656_9ACTN|nr:MFS transporter [Jatrophihabitans endophyticus]SHH33971.1 Predicted arabinose efflux permease, MFS family [Jatrophihabitans endophyticus]
MTIDVAKGRAEPPANVRELSDQAIQRVLNKQGTDSGRRNGWLMISTILIEAWDLYSISFLLIFIKDEFHPSASMLGLTSAAVQGGALLGAIFGGYLSDRFGRRPVFLTTMILFVILAVAQAFATNMWELAAIRLLLGFPLGSDVASSYAYIMETMPKQKREVMGSRWQGMFGLGEIAAIIVITVLYLTGMDHGTLWRLGLALGAVPALALLIGRLDVPETTSSLILRGRFRKAKQVAKEVFDDDLPMLPDQDYDLKRPRTRDFLADIWKHKTRRRASIFAWISNACQGAEFTAFGYYLPVILVLTGVSGIGATNFLTGAIYLVATISGFVAPIALQRLGHRGLSQWGFGLAFVSLLLAALFLQVEWKWLVPIAAAGLMWGHYWDASNGMTIASMVAPTRYKGTASGFGYIFVKAASFATIYGFPQLFDHLGVPLATVLISSISLVGFLAARFVLPEVYGHVETDDEVPASAVPA